MRVLIIGCGYVGRELGIQLAGEGHVVTGLRRSDAGAADLQAAGIQPVVADITRREDLERLAPAFDWVVNCVSSAGGGAEAYRTVYLEGMRNVIAWLAAAPPRKFIYTSSTGVYAQEDGGWVTEESAAEPAAETSRCLRDTEQCLLAAARERQFPGVVLRVAGIYGPGRGHYFQQFMNGAAWIEGTGGRILNMIHRDDVAGAIRATLAQGRAGEVYNVVDHQPVTQREFFQWLAEKTGRPLPPMVPPEANLPRRRPATNKRVSNRKLVAELGYRFKFPTFREGFENFLPGAGNASGSGP